MTEKEIQRKYKNKWLLLDKNKKIIFYSKSIVDVVIEGDKYPIEEVTIEKKLIKGTCFF